VTPRARGLTLETLTVEQDERVLVVRVYNPPYNLMTAHMQKTSTPSPQLSTTTRAWARSSSPVAFRTAIFRTSTFPRSLPQLNADGRFHLRHR
jgi:hypothetical protein